MLLWRRFFVEGTWASREGSGRGVKMGDGVPKRGTWAEDTDDSDIDEVSL